jgi:hypothetical protein
VSGGAASTAAGLWPRLVSGLGRREGKVGWAHEACDKLGLLAGWSRGPRGKVGGRPSSIRLGQIWPDD